MAMAGFPDIPNYKGLVTPGGDALLCLVVVELKANIMA